MTRPRHFASLAALTAILACNHTALAGGRVVASLDALQRGASPIDVGILIATFGFLPMLCALHAGRLIDGIGVGRPLVAGTALSIAGVGVPWLFPGLAGLYIAAPMLGLGVMLSQVAVQRAVGELGTAADRAGNFGFLSLGSSAAIFAGPLIAGFAIDALGHQAAFGILMTLPIAAGAVLASRRLPLPVLAPPEDTSAKRLFDLLKHPRLRRLFLINAVVSLGWDVHTVFLPIYGTQIGLSSAQIGMALSSFAAASFVVRFTIRWIARRWSERQILMCALLLAALALPLLPMTREPILLMLLSFVMGLGLGTGQPMVMSLLHAHAPPGRMGEAAGVRISLIQSMGVAVPLVFGVVASSAGLLPVFWLAGLCVGAGGITVQRSRD